jgi:hypothetical protein
MDDYRRSRRLPAMTTLSPSSEAKAGDPAPIASVGRGDNESTLIHQGNRFPSLPHSAPIGNRILGRG